MNRSRELGKSALAVVVASCACSFAIAEMAPIYGPTTVVRTSEAPQSISDTFSNCELQAEYRLIAVNGTEALATRVTSASISVNGVEVVKPSAFNKLVDRVAVPISTVRNNSIETRLTGEPGSFITVSIECSANCLGISISDPVSSAVLNTSEVLVRGTIESSSDSPSVVVNGALGRVSGTEFAVYPVALSSGRNTLTATCKNACGNTSSSSIDVVSNPTSPATARLASFPSFGIAPLTIRLRFVPLDGMRLPSVHWDFGDGTSEDSGAPEVTHQYEKPGLFFPFASAQAGTYQARNAVQVANAPEFATMIGDRWRAFRAAMVTGDVDSVQAFIHPSAVANIRVALQKMGANLRVVGAALGDLQFSTLRGEIAEFTTAGQLEGRSVVFVVSFAQDGEGQWKILSL